MTIEANGNIGIGTSNPSYTLDVTGKLNVANTYALDPLIRLATTTSGNVEVQMRTATTTYNAGIGVVTSGYDFGLFTSNTTRMTITSAGNVGIGTSSPGQRLTVLQSTESWSSSFSNSNGVESVDVYLAYGSGHGMAIDSTENDSKYILKAAAGTGNGTGKGSVPIFSALCNGDVLIGTTSSPSPYGRVTIRSINSGLTIQDATTNGYRAIYPQSGALYFYNGTNEGYLSSGGTWVNASDVTLKKDVKEIEYGIAEVMKLKPKWYKMIEDDLEQIGFIAQDVEEVLPELVSTSQRGMKGLSYGQLTAVLTKAIQEQQAQIEELSNRLIKLESK
jgi:hypothetical protein